MFARELLQMTDLPDVSCSEVADRAVSRLAQETLIYPNPNDGFFTIFQYGDEARFRLMDMLGQELKSIFVPKGTQVNINISDLSSGMYVLQNLSEGSTFKVIKQ